MHPFSVRDGFQVSTPYLDARMWYNQREGVQYLVWDAKINHSEGAEWQAAMAPCKQVRGLQGDKCTTGSVISNQGTEI